MSLAGTHPTPDLEALLREHAVAGAVASTRAAGEWSTHAAGLRDVERALPVEPDTAFEAGSISKPLFATALLQLVAEGALELDRPVIELVDTSLLPSSKSARAITSHHLLTHTSGLPNWRTGRFSASPGPLKLLSNPGERFGYSGEGFQILQAVAEAISGVPLEAFMRERLLDPLGMQASSYGWLPRYEETLARGYTSSGQPAPAFDPKLAQPLAAASLITTASDLARWIDALLAPDARRALGLPADPRSLFFEPRVEVAPGVAWALGTGVARPGDAPVAWHWCSTRASFFAFVAACADTGEATIALTNAPGGRALCEAIVRAAIDGPQPMFGAPPLD